MGGGTGFLQQFQEIVSGGQDLGGRAVHFDRDEIVTRLPTAQRDDG